MTESTPSITRLLVSVRSADEAEQCLDAGVDLIDIKEPMHGSLGAAELDTVADVVARIAGRAPLSVALGELVEARGLPPHFAGEVRFAKFGMADCAHRPDWHDRWRAAIERLPARVAPVAVGYADWKSAGAPPPEVILERAKSLNCQAFLIDTFDKRAGDLLAHLSEQQLNGLLQAARRARLLCVFAGSLCLGAIERLSPLAPDYFAVRGAACGGKRCDALDAARLRELVEVVRSLARDVCMRNREPSIPTSSARFTRTKSAITDHHKNA